MGKGLLDMLFGWVSMDDGPLQEGIEERTVEDEDHKVLIGKEYINKYAKTRWIVSDVMFAESRFTMQSGDLVIVKTKSGEYRTKMMWVNEFLSNYELVEERTE